MRSAWFSVFIAGLSGLTSASVQDCTRKPGCGSPAPAPQQVEVRGIKLQEPAPALQIPTVPLSSLMAISTRGLGSASERQSGSVRQGPAQPTPPAPGEEAKEPAPAENNSSANRCDGNPTSSNPVILATGEKLLHHSDIRAGGSYRLAAGRSYRSASTDTGMFGPKWTGSHDFKSLGFSGPCHYHPDFPSVCLPKSVRRKLPDGTAYVFTRDPAADLTWRVAGSSAGGSLTYNGPGSSAWLLEESDRTHQFNSAGMLQNIRSRSGAPLLSVSYLPNTNRVVRVIDVVGRSIDYTWTGARVTGVRDPAGQWWTYAYNAQGMLSEVRSPTAAGVVRTYHYESPVGASYLTGFSVNGVRQAAYSYFADGRVQRSAGPQGEFDDRFEYGATTTRQTDINGLTTTYTFAAIQGTRKLTTTSHAGGSDCPSSTASTTYDANGWTASTVDFNGVRTALQHDAQGRLLTRTLAVGTPEALIETHAWRNDLLQSTDHKRADGSTYLRSVYGYDPAGNLLTTDQIDAATGALRRLRHAVTYHPNGVIARHVVWREAVGTAIPLQTLEYDAGGDLVASSNALGHRTTYLEYNGLGFPQRTVNPNGVATALR